MAHQPCGQDGLGRGRMGGGRLWLVTFSYLRWWHGMACPGRKMHDGAFSALLVSCVLSNLEAALRGNCSFG